MSWKEFFKPKWYKILVALIICIFLFMGIQVFDSCLGGCGHPLELLIILHLSAIIISYTLSCLYSFLFNFI
jgi:hypothetical protein